jgi:hypothetical protein
MESNYIFSASVRAAIQIKNNLDYRKGITSPEVKKFQTQKIRCLLRAIIDKGNLSQLGLYHLTKSGINTVGTWSANAARGTKRTFTNPSNTKKSMYDTLFKKVGGRKRRTIKRKPTRRIKRKSIRYHKRKSRKHYKGTK